MIAELESNWVHIFIWPSTTSLVQLLLICSTESQFLYGIEKRKIDPENQLFMGLVKLRQKS